jgi:hypothetical protein
MALSIQVSSDLGKAANWSNQFAKQLPFAIATALNNTAFDVRANTLPGATKQFFDRPTPFIQKAWRVDKASKSRLVVTIGAENKRVRVIRRQIQGGPRVRKPFEARFGIGTLIPADGIKLNQYGNVPLATLKFITKNLSSSDRGGFFAGTPKGGNRPLGIYRRSREQLFPQFIAVRQPTYRPRFPMPDVVAKAYQRRYGTYLRSSLERALATAR